jgi:hypothetical protein
MCFAYVIPVSMFTDIISKEQQEIPKYKFAGDILDLACGRFIADLFLQLWECWTH